MADVMELPQIASATTTPSATKKRRAMIDAAEQLFLAHGYGDTSMDAVARLAGVSKATLYAHFTSKDVLFATIVGERGMMQKFDETEMPAEIDDLHASLMRVGHCWLDFMVRPRTLAIYRIAVAESARFPELGRAFYLNGPHKTHRRFAEWARGLQARGMIEAEDLDSAAWQFFALLRGLMFMRATLAVEPPDEAEIDAGVRDAVRTWMKAFGRQVSPPA